MGPESSEPPGVLAAFLACRPNATSRKPQESGPLPQAGGERGYQHRDLRPLHHGQGSQSSAGRTPMLLPLPSLLPEMPLPQPYLL